MLTAKVVHESGEEEVFSIEDASYDPTSLGAGTVRFNRQTKGLCAVSAGQVYVMNEAGKTVAKYDLSGPSNPEKILNRRNVQVNNLGGGVWSAHTVNADVATQANAKT